MTRDYANAESLAYRGGEEHYDPPAREDVEKIRRNPPVIPRTNQELLDEQGPESSWFKPVPEVVTLLARIDYLDDELAQRDQRVEELEWKVWEAHATRCWSVGQGSEGVSLLLEPYPCPTCRAYYDRLHKRACYVRVRGEET